MVDHSTDIDNRQDETAYTHSRRWLGLAVLTLPTLLVSMTFSVLYLALPSISDALNPSATQQLWILDVYGFAIAGLLITMGNLGDRFGRRRVLLLGAALFGIASLLTALSPNAFGLIVGRALMGIGGATLLPSSLSLIANIFTDARERGRAIGIWSAAFAGGSAIGPVLGGLLLNYFWWGSVFLVNIPVLAILFFAAPRLVPEYKAPTSEPFDILGVALSMAGILPVVYAIKTVAAQGLDILSLASAVVGVVLLVLFVRHERHFIAPLLDLQLFKNMKFTSAVALGLVGMMSLSGVSYLTSIYLQSVLGHGALLAAAAGLPMAVTVATFSIAANKVLNTFGTRAALIGAALVITAANVALLSLSTSGPIWVYLAATAVSGVGYGVLFSVIADVVVGSVPPERSGAASGISEMSFELGIALGLALLGSLATVVFRHHSDSGRFSETLSSTLQEAKSLGSDGDTLAELARAAFVDGMHAAFLAAAVLLTLLSLVVWRVTRPPRNVHVNADTDTSVDPTKTKAEH